MPVFAVIPQPNPNSGKLSGAVSAHFVNEFYQLEDGKGWLISAKGTAQELSAKLGIAVRHDGFEAITFSGCHFYDDPGAHRTDSHVESPTGIHFRTRPSRSIH